MADVSTRLAEHITDYNNVNQKVTDVSVRVKTNTDAITLINQTITTDFLAVNSKIIDLSSGLSDVSAKANKNQTDISNVSTRLAEHLNDHDNTVADVSALKTLTANHTSRLDGHDASITSLSEGLLSTNASIYWLRNDVSATNNLIVIYDTSLRSDVSTLATTLTTHLNDFDVSVRNHFVALDDSVSYLTVERNRLDASITNLTNYIDTTVTQILSTDRARINAIESLAVDTSAYVHDSLLAYGIHLDSSLNQYDSHIDASLNEYDSHIDASLNQYDSHLDASLNQYDSYINDTLNQFGAHLDSSLVQYYDAFDEYGVVVASALAQHDSSILNLIARVTALENR